MTIFLTGATGYIGTAVAEALHRAGYTVTGLARTPEVARRLEEQGYRSWRGDLRDAARLQDGARAADAVIHLAVSGDADAGALEEAAVHTLLEALEGTGKPFLYTTGTWVLGDTGSGVADEDTALDPPLLMARRKGLEAAVRAAAERGVRSVVIRPAIVYGRGAGLPGMLVAWAREYGAARYLGTGENRWSFVHLDDLADLYVRALDAPAGTLLIGAHGPAIPLHTVAEAAARVAGVEGEPIAWPLDEARAALGPLADALALDQQVSGERARALLGWDPQAPSILDDLAHGSYSKEATRRAAYICATCGTQFAPSDGAPSHCPVCEDERQYVGWGGQRWTTMEALRATRKNVIRVLEPGLAGILTEPTFAIGQQALLVRHPEGNVLWDCLTLLDDATVEAVNALGGLSAIAISHPHYYSSMVAWSRAFGGVPLYLHAADRAHVVHPDPAIVFWEGETQALPGGLTLIRTGGHFDGSTVLHWPGGAGGRGALLTGDTIKVSSDRRYVSFMYSYPNLVPLPAAAVWRVVDAVAPFAFDRIYGAWYDHVVRTDARAAVLRSADRYLQAIEADLEAPVGAATQ